MVRLYLQSFCKIFCDPGEELFPVIEQEETAHSEIVETRTVETVQFRPLSRRHLRSSPIGIVLLEKLKEDLAQAADSSVTSPGKKKAQFWANLRKVTIAVQRAPTAAVLPPPAIFLPVKEFRDLEDFSAIWAEIRN
ncbi:hypothetical protein U1Q18_018714 [Sarracenia purpurea var. burkii]